MFFFQFYEQDLSRLGREVPAPPSSGSEYIPAVDSLNEISDSGYERDDDWRPKVRIMELSSFNILSWSLVVMRLG